MANRYVIHGATFNGDGTTSSEAASNGAAGAWNTINVMTGTAPVYGTLTHGDTVFIRSKTAAGADVTVVAAAATNIGIAPTSAASATNWVIDNGATWPGVSGTVAFEHPSATSYSFSLRGNNNLIGFAHNLRFRTPTTSTGNSGSLLTTGIDTGIYGNYLHQVHFDQSSNTNAEKGPVCLTVGVHGIIADGCYIKSMYPDTAAVVCNDSTTGATYLFKDCEFEMPAGWGTKASVGAGCIYFNNVSAGRLKFVGGRCFGAGLVTGKSVLSVVSARGGQVEAQGFQWPYTATFVTRVGAPSGSIRPAPILTSGSEGKAGIAWYSPIADVDSRDDGAYPYLNATLPNSTSTGFALRVYAPMVSKALPGEIPTLQKFYQLAAATKTITLELLTKVGAGETKDNIWMSVSYVDSGGTGRTETTMIPDGSALDTSTAAWSALTYGPTSFNKRKLALTTDYAIKQDSVVYVQVYWGLRSAVSTDIGFVCPDFQVT